MQKKARSSSQIFAAQPRAILSYFFLWTLYSASSPQCKSAQQVSEKKARAFLRNSSPRTPAFFFLITPFVSYTTQASQAKSAQQVSEKKNVRSCTQFFAAHARASLSLFLL